MKQGRIVILTGSPATGKSTAADLLANTSDYPKSVHMLTDDFYHYIRKGVIAPNLPEANQQNKVVIKSFLEATKVFADNGYEVIVDGIVGPWFLQPWMELTRNYEVHYVILRATKAETMRRALGRKKLDEATNVSLVETMWKQFNNLDQFENNVIDTTSLNVEQTVTKIRQCILTKNNILM
ncbi:hypothetical protein D1B17_11745 [Companilactobacillus zhachilii]|uniref:AAA family ATPase n=1 Tax=Companilactobacillus zhachilii TaxID=2304606 RepID=A0A386PX01_9LACO|nr:AAA family ATPase [Companilactobacillus zhachilii]AYE39263.1 hypothetical protein D1B17_11745 [Companilactobacillus zhachilii]